MKYQITHPLTKKDISRIRRSYNYYNKSEWEISVENHRHIGSVINRYYKGVWITINQYCWELDENKDAIWRSLRTLQRRKRLARMMLEQPNAFSMDEMELAEKIIEGLI